MELERIVNVDRVEDLISVFGSFDENIKRIEESLGVSIINRGNELKVTGDAEAVDKAALCAKLYASWHPHDNPRSRPCRYRQDLFSCCCSCCSVSGKNS